MQQSHTHGREVQLHSLLNSAVDGGELLTSSPSHFTTWENPRGWVGPRPSPDNLENK